MRPELRFLAPTANPGVILFGGAICVVFPKIGGIAMAALTVTGSATVTHGGSGMVTVHISVTRDDGSPVGALTGSNFSLKLAGNFSAIDVPTTFTYPVIDPETAQPVIDPDTGEPEMQTVDLIHPLGLPGFYYLSSAIPPYASGNALQIRVAVDANQGQVIVSPQ
jgi:hypothetical protein